MEVEQEHLNAVKTVQAYQMEVVQFHGMEVAVHMQQVVIADIHY